MVSMGLSKGQKKRLYGENTQAQVKTPQATKPAPQAQPTPRVITDYSRGELAATPESGSSYIFLGVAFVVTLLFALYYHLMLLPGVSAAAGAKVPELMVWFTPDHLHTVASGLGVDGLQGYQILHRSTGLIFPLIFAFTWWNMVRASKFELLAGRLMLALPVAYALVFIAGGFALDLALANPLGGTATLAALLIATRWVLFILCLAQLAIMAVRLVRGKMDAFARGELPGQH